MAQDVVGEGDVLDDRPGRGAVLVAHREQNGEAVLRLYPVVLEGVPVNQHPARVLQLENILDRPGAPRKTLTALLPSKRLREVVAAKLDIRGDEPVNSRVGAAEHNIFT